MRKSTFNAAITICVIAAIAYGVATSEVGSGWFWPHVGVSLLWGELGLAVALLVTFPILRRWDLVLTRLALGAIVIPLVGFLPSMGYQDLQLYRDGARAIRAADLAQLPDQPVLAQLSGVWRYDLAMIGTYHAHRGGTTSGRCSAYEITYCRVPIVADDWQPGQPVLAIATCKGQGQAEPRTGKLARLIPAHDAALRLNDFETDDAMGKSVYHGACSSVPDEHPDLSAARFHFDAAHGYLVFPLKSGVDDQRSIAIIEVLFALAALAVAFRRSNRRARVATKRERDAQNSASG
jgi:hypothetical protein